MNSQLILCLAIILSGGLFGCSSLRSKNGAATEDMPPVTLGCACFDFDPPETVYQTETNAIPVPPPLPSCSLSLIWVAGNHTLHDPDPWCGDGEKYTGKFVFRVKLADGRTVDTALESLCSDGCFDFIFADEAEPWPIKMADYNNDGQPDFNIVTYAGCSLSECHLFTIAPSGKVTVLKFDKGNSFTINKESDQSIDELAGNLTSTGFYYEYYDHWNGPKVKLDVESFDWDPQMNVFHQHDHIIQLRQ